MGGVLIIDDDEDLREALGELTAKLSGERGVVVGSLAELAQLEARALQCSVAIIDINLGSDVPNGIDVYDWLRARRFAGRIVFLSGHGPSHPLVQRASTLAHAHVVRKPMSDEELRELVAPPAPAATVASRRSSGQPARSRFDRRGAVSRTRRLLSAILQSILVVAAQGVARRARLYRRSPLALHVALVGVAALALGDLVLTPSTGARRGVGGARHAHRRPAAAHPVGGAALARAGAAVGVVSAAACCHDDLGYGAALGLAGSRCCSVFFSMNTRRYGFCSYEALTMKTRHSSPNT